MSSLRIIAVIGALFIPLFLVMEIGLAQAPQPGPSPTTVEPAYVPGEILVKFRSDGGALRGQSMLQAEGARPVEVSALNGVMRVRVPPGRETEIIAKLRTRNDVELAGLNHILTAFDMPNDPDFILQWGLNNTGQTGGVTNADIDAPEAWAIETGQAEIIIAVLDTGVDLDHPDLQANITAGYDFVNGDNDPDDDNGHGTHVAGVAAAVGDNGVGTAGVSWHSKIMPVKALDSGGGGTEFNVAQGIYYAVGNGAQVINMSLGAKYSEYPCLGQEVILDALQRAVANNVLVVVSAGNENYYRVSCPAAFEEVLAVGATNAHDARWEWSSAQGSNYEDRLDIAAPGEDIYSTLPVWLNSYGDKTGTSMAAPHVTGLAALLWSYDPSLTNHDVRSIIEARADDLGSVGYDIHFGHGRINARQALESLVSLRLSGPAQTEFAIYDNTSVFPGSGIQLISGDSNPVTWTASLSPTVSWLHLSSISGTVSAASPAAVSMTLTRPVDYGIYNAAVIISGVDAAGMSLGIRTSRTITLTYYRGDKPFYHYFPIIRVNRDDKPFYPIFQSSE